MIESLSSRAVLLAMMFPKVNRVPKAGRASTASASTVAGGQEVPAMFRNYFAHQDALMKTEGKPFDSFVDTLLVACNDAGLQGAMDIDGNKEEQAQRARR